MKVYKFGGASVKDVNGIKNLLSILKNEVDPMVIVVISAMGKTTNALEDLLNKSINSIDFQADLLNLKKNHWEICEELFDQKHPIFHQLEQIFKKVELCLSTKETRNYDFEYDQVVSYGEILSTIIVSEYLLHQSLNCLWMDARELIFTDSNYRAAQVDLEKTVLAVQEIKNKEAQIIITQGFIGMDDAAHTTTLGREGSDYSAALIAYALNVEEVSIWKDVDGVLNADPKIFKHTQFISELSYREAIELAFYGASVIHPKTIQPLQRKNIKLLVRPFKHPEQAGTLVWSKSLISPPLSIIVKKKQVLLSLIPRDLSFMDAPQMSFAFQTLAQHQHHINLIQNSAVSFSMCLDYNHFHFEEMIAALSNRFEVRYNLDQTLVTIRNYNEELIDKIYDKVKIKLEQRTRTTYQLLLSESEFEKKLLDLFA